MERKSVAIRYGDLRFDVLAPEAVCDALAIDPTVERTVAHTERSDVAVSRVEGGHLVEGGTERELLRTVSPEAVAESVRVLCNRLTVLGRSDEWTLHAGCVALDGTALALMAPSGTGKSTLTGYLVSRGWEYLSDELARIEPGGARVLAYPKPMNLSDASLSMIEAEHGRSAEIDTGGDGSEVAGTQRWGAYSAEHLGGTTRTTACRLGAIVLLSRAEADRSFPHVASMSGADRAAALLANQTNFLEAGNPLDKVRRLVATVPMARVTIGDLAGTEGALTDWLDRQPAPIAGTDVEFSPVSDDRAVDSRMAHGAMSFPLRAPSATAIEFDDGTVLLFDRAERGYLVTQTWALRLLDRADGRSTVQRLACEGNVPTPSAIEFFRGAELAGMLNLSGSLIGGLR